MARIGREDSREFGIVCSGERRVFRTSEADGFKLLELLVLASASQRMMDRR